MRPLVRETANQTVGLICIVLLAPGDSVASYSVSVQQAPAGQQQPAKIPPDQLDSLVAPIALYPDPLLAQTLAASTYPLEIIQLQQWLQKNSGLKDKALADAVANQLWNPSVQALAPMPDLVQFLANDLQWTTDLGNAFLAQQGDVMAAVQRMRKKAQEKVNLKSGEQQSVGYDVNQYAQHIISSPGKQDGLACKNPNGTWGGPIGEKVEMAISQRYSGKEMPYHRYYFKVLEVQGPAAPLGQLDYVNEGLMIGGFAMVAAPAEYRVTGVKTFMVSQDGVVYQKDLGPTTLEQFRKMERFNPDRTWTPVPE